MTPDEYHYAVTTMIHDIRVDPSDTVTLCILADVIEEFGKPGAQDRTCRHLRDGKMVVNSTDVLARGWLARYSLRKDESRRLASELGQIGESSYRTHRLENDSGTNAVVTLEAYDFLWTLVCKYRYTYRMLLDGVRLNCTDVLDEANLVAADRMAKGRADPSESLEKQPGTAQCPACGGTASVGSACKTTFVCVHEAICRKCRQGFVVYGAGTLPDGCGPFLADRDEAVKRAIECE